MRIFLIIILICLFNSCAETGPCWNISCTEIFVMVPVRVTDNNDNNVSLDSTITTDDDDMILYRYANNDQGSTESYTVLTDGEIDQVKFRGTDVTMKGWKDGIQLFEEKFTIGKDCCHIEKTDGPEVIIVDSLSD